MGFPGAVIFSWVSYTDLIMSKILCVDDDRDGRRRARKFWKATASVLCTGIPAGDIALKIFADDSVVGRIDDGGENIPGIRGLLIGLGGMRPLTELSVLTASDRQLGCDDE
jgi:hypothetical protein